MEALQRASSVLFYALGVVTIVAIVLVQRGITVSAASIFLSIVDLPLLLTGMLFGGSTLVSSLSQERTSPTLMLAVFIPLAIIFLAFVYFNFALPFQPEL